METLFERFHVELPEKPEEVNLIGVDFGDGELSAVLAREKDGRIEADPLFPDTARVGYKCPNVLFIPSDPALPCRIGLGNFQNGRAYYNFKKCPGTNEARSKYRLENGEADCHSNEELMRMAFQEFIRLLFSCNSHSISREKRTILVVGRPAGAKWEKREEQYAALLGDGLHIDGYEQRIDVLVVSESLAAFARETNPAIEESRRIRRGETVLIVDCGSSTFDVTLVSGDHIPENGEYSRAFGGGMIEELMLKCYGIGKTPDGNLWPERLLRLRQYCGEGAHTEERMVCAHNRLELRKKKEDYYGKTGEDGTETGIYAVFYEPGQGQDANAEYESWFIKKSLMGQVLHRMPVRLGSASLRDSEASVRQFPSWYSACRSVFKEAARQMEAHLNGRLPDKVILTGGVSVMPEVRRLARECFGREPVMAELPNYSVVEGLSYVAAMEILKNQELKALQLRVRDIITGCGQSMEKTVADVLSMGTYQVLLHSLEAWRDSAKDESLADWKERFSQERSRSVSIGSRVKEGLSLWYERDEIEEEINCCLRERFDHLFPGFEDQFCFQIDQEAVQQAFSGIEVKLKIRSMLIFGFFAGLRPNRPRTFRERQLCCRKAKNRSGRILHEMSAEYQNQLQVRDRVQEKLLQALLPSLREYVERMTPYFQLTRELPGRDLTQIGGESDVGNP